MKKIILALAGVALACPFFLAGCGGSISDLCQRQCDCGQTCEQKDVEECETEGNKEQSLAANNGCSSEFDELLSCANGATCQELTKDLRVCAAQSDALEKCLGPAAE